MNIKGGEVYTTGEENLHENQANNVDERPRTICNPSEDYCGLLTILQTLFWPILKQSMPGFIQGYTKD